MSEEHTGPARGEDTARRLEADERYFRRQGLPTLIEDYSATEDILTRAWPWLAVLFLVQVMRSIATSWTPRMAGAILAGSVCAILAAWALVNRWKSRRLFAPPSRLGWWSATVFVLVPSLMRMSGGDVMPALRHVAFNVAVCTLVVGVIGWGLAQTLAWALLRLIADLGRQLVIVFRQMAAIFLFCFLLFFTQEMWQFATVSDPVRFRTLAGVLAAFALLMVVAGTPRLTRQLEGDLLDESERLTWGQRTNLTLLFAIRQSLQLCVILLVAFAVFAVLSVAVVGQELYAAWDLPPAVVDSFRYGGQTYILTSAGLRVSLVLSLAAAVNFAVLSLTSAEGRENFLEGVEEEIRAVFERRRSYLRARLRP